MEMPQKQGLAKQPRRWYRAAHLARRSWLPAARIPNSEDATVESIDRLNSTGAQLPDRNTIIKRYATNLSALNVTKQKIERWLVGHRSYFLYLQIPLLASLLFLIALPALAPETIEGESVLNRTGSVILFAVWALWFPLVLLSVVVIGRAWCGVACPMGFATERSSQAGLQARPPAWIRSDVMPVASLFLVMLWGESASMDESIAATSRIFGMLLFAALALGFTFGRGKRIWCRHVCPIGGLLGAFSRLGAVEFSSLRKLAIGPDAYSCGGVCPVMIDISRKAGTRHCIECFRCVNPSAKGSIRLGFRWPGREITNIADYSPSLPEVFSVFSATGIVLGAFLFDKPPVEENLQAFLAPLAALPGWSWLTQSGPHWLVGGHDWLRFFSVLICLLTGAFFTLSVLSSMTALSVWLTPHEKRRITERQLFAVLGSQYIPVAMLSVFVIFCAPLINIFDSAKCLNLSCGKITGTFVIMLGIAWSLYSQYHVLKQMLVPRRDLWRPMLPELLGTLAIGIAMLPTIL